MAQPIHSEDHRSDLSVVEARQGITPGYMRYVLGISMALVVAAFLIILFAFHWPS